MVRIGFGMRFLAALIDGIIVGIAGFIVGFIIGMILGPGNAAAAIGGLVGGLIGLAYYYMEVMKAASLGKQLLKLQITAQDGSPASKDQLMKRYLFKQAPNIIMTVGALMLFVPAVGRLVQGVGGLAALLLVISACMTLRASKLAYHDELFGTAVYGAGTAPQGFPVQMPGQGTNPPNPPVA